ncbi:flavohemoglobin expression-modulating QEGLA motif protein [Oceanospirillum beijerinckii]|uniref:flavohemoglobin expression-modulating QEGLA motif protein n=1 Tax=Oceanospirillum beijerinckii TaxID=64976 RepID=UPI000421DB3F|nr:flavohemoglobin expression-modulating QEGLA motif protein [Oceanospirillum beijerinckii]
MQRLSEKEILRRIRQGEAFECLAEDDSFTLKVEEYTPAIYTAIHDGHQFRSSLEKYSLLSEAERYQEEDPFTGEMIQAMPITLIGMDSRYEYDLNRPVATCVYKKAWGKQVWHKPISVSQRQASIEKHKRFYRILDALVEKVEQLYGACIVFDMHSYNGFRQSESAPVFNLGTEQVDMDRWQRVVKRFERQLNSITLQGVPVRAASNEVFYGRGYLIAHTNSRFENTLVIPCEVKKVFMDEHSGEVFRLVLDELKEGLKHSLSDTAAFFARNHTRRASAKRLDMLSSQLDPAIRKLDQALYTLARDLETLYYINPINIAQEKRRFFSKKGNYRPEFRYRPLAVDPYHFREQLYRLPVDEIRDPGIQQMYRQTIDGLSSKIDLLVHAGSEQFVYSSLKYYGEPSIEDEANARFLLHAAGLEETEDNTVSAEEACDYFRKCAADWGMNCKVEPNHRLVAGAMVSDRKKTLYVNANDRFAQSQLQALAHHELGVHMATTLNARLQPLRVFSLGLPGNTMTQEGLAILNEYHTGNLPLKRLQSLAHRVLAVKAMLKHGDFHYTFNYLHEEMKLDQDSAFGLAVRVHRGGGFTKDYLYLRGVSEALRLSQSRDIRNLYIGKTGFAYLSLIDEMIERGILNKPRFIAEGLTLPQQNSEVLTYLMMSVRPTAPATEPPPMLCA